MNEISKRKYTKKITVRINEKENEKLTQLAKETGQSLSRFLVNLGLGKTIRPLEEKEIIASLAKEIHKMGTNINQIAYQLNVMQLRGGTIDLRIVTEACEEAKKALKKVREQF